MSRRGTRRPGPNGGNSAEVKPSFCSSRIKEAFERQRVFLFHGGPSKLQAMLVPELCCWGGGGGGWRVEGGGDRSVWTQAGDRVTRSGERNMLLRGCWKEDSVSSVCWREREKEWGERVRQGYRKRQMEGRGVRK